MKYIIKEFKKLTPLCIFIFIIGSIHSIGLGISLIGLFLLTEHMWSYGEWDFFDILGHETFGIILLLIGLFLLGNYISMLVSLITYVLFANYEWDECGLTPIKYALDKIKFIGG